MQMQHSMRQVGEMRQMLSPRMMLSMRMLELSALALSEHVEQELTENPMLESERDAGFEGDDDAPDRDREPSVDPDLPERLDPSPDGYAEGKSVGGEGDGPAEAEREGGGTDAMLEQSPGDEPELRIGDDDHQAEDFDRLDGFGDTLDNVWEGADLRSSSGQDESGRDKKMEMMANAPQRPASLSEQLEQQLALAELPPRVRLAAELVLASLDERGFLTTPLEELPALARRPLLAPADPAAPAPPDPHLNGHAGEQPTSGPGSAARDDESPLLRELAALSPPLSFDEFVDALDAVQGFDPPGVGARDMRECLLIQLERLDPALDEDGLRLLAARLVNDCFAELQRNQLPAVEQKLGQPLERVRAALGFIREHCDLTPGLTAASAPNPMVIPDVTLELNEGTGEYDIILHDTYLPPLQISKSLRETMEGGSLDKATREYLAKKLNDARWLIDAIEQRRSTLRRVIREVVTRQREFVDHGPRHLRPLPMVDVAARLGVDVSTVSRAVKDKYVQCPRGIFALRDCFTAGTQTQAGESVSYDAIREQVREIIDAEDKSSPLSDDAVVDLLKSRGITLARRTVAKYRGELDIPTARQRKRF